MIEPTPGFEAGDLSTDGADHGNGAVETSSARPFQAAGTPDAEQLAKQREAVERWQAQSQTETAQREQSQVRHRSERRVTPQTPEQQAAALARNDAEVARLYAEKDAARAGRQGPSPEQRLESLRRNDAQVAAFYAKRMARERANKKSSPGEVA